MGCLQFVRSFRVYVSFAKKPYKRDDILQKRGITLTSIHPQVRHQLAPHVRVNHFRNHNELTHKGHMVKNFKRMICNLRREDRASEAAQYDFFPVTYLLPMEYGVFVEDFKRQADKPIWIAKPTGKAQV